MLLSYVYIFIRSISHHFHIIICSLFSYVQCRPTLSFSHSTSSYADIHPFGVVLRFLSSIQRHPTLSFIHSTSSYVVLHPFDVVLRCHSSIRRSLSLSFIHCLYFFILTNKLKFNFYSLIFFLLGLRILTQSRAV